MLNQTAEYALRAVIYLAENNGAGPRRVSDIADALDVPQNYLSKVLHVLAREGVLTSTRGPAGGFALRRSAERLKLASVVSPFDPIEDRCLLMRRRCTDANPCTAHHEWKSVALKLRAFFRETSIADLIRGAQASGRPAHVLLGSGSEHGAQPAPTTRRNPG
jgi:Rrf2 family transcriptional regulator, iron-sulfur cluster assembly transcription factor